MSRAHALIPILPLLSACGGRTGLEDPRETAGEPHPAGLCAENPLAGSCIDELLSRCWAPAPDARCRGSRFEAEWSDGHRAAFADWGFVASGPGDDDGLYYVEDYVRGRFSGRGLADVPYEVVTPAEGARPEIYRADCQDGQTLIFGYDDLGAFHRCRGLICEDP